VGDRKKGKEDEERRKWREGTENFFGEESLFLIARKGEAFYPHFSRPVINCSQGSEGWGEEGGRASFSLPLPATACE